MFELSESISWNFLYLEECEIYMNMVLTNNKAYTGENYYFPRTSWSACCIFICITYGQAS